MTLLNDMQAVTIQALPRYWSGWTHWTTE